MDGQEVLFSVRIIRYLCFLQLWYCKRIGIHEMKSSSSTGSYQLVGILLVDQNNQNDDDGEVIMATVRTRRLLKANRNLLRPRPWDLSSCEQRALWLCVLLPSLVGGRTLQVVATRKELLRREGERDLLLFLSSHHWRARPWPAWQAKEHQRSFSL